MLYICFTYNSFCSIPFTTSIVRDYSLDLHCLNGKQFFAKNMLFTEYKLDSSFADSNLTEDNEVELAGHSCILKLLAACELEVR